jgi:hypothetical protein
MQSFHHGFDSDGATIFGAAPGPPTACSDR